ncbi:MAG: L,D-transpeptidase family protein [Chitinophagaceae bacterium]|nr:L,D-transpeptidase family protein [Chitinophagaceae bacterium]
MKYLIGLCLLWLSVTVNAQQSHRRDNYFEAFVQVTDSIDSIVVYKAKREMQTYRRGQKVKKYMISLGMNPEGPKQFEGDLKTPEGHYHIHTRSRESSYYANLGIDYPSMADSLAAINQNKNPGGDIKIHGFPNKHLKSQEREFLNTDWTIGCIAVSNYEIDELYNWVIANCPISILP